MIQCSECGKVIASIASSTELQLRGEISLSVVCGCGNVEEVYMSQYKAENLMLDLTKG